MTPTRILLIDDDAVDRAAVRRALAASDLEVTVVEATDGASGLAAARAEPFDGVLLDYRLPDIDAFDLLPQLLAPEAHGQAVIMLTGEGDPEVALRLMRAGALDYLAKAELSASGLARAIRYASARRGFLAELDAARHEAEEKSAALDLLNRQKSLLFSIIAHDLRNPFQLLLGLSDSLSHAVASRDHATVERRAQGLHQAAGQAHALMEGLFHWADIQMHSAEVAFAALPLAAVIADAIVDCRGSASAKELELETAIDDLTVRAQRDMLAAIVRNLVGNAIKFPPPGGRIRIAAAAEAGVGAVRLSIADTGVGMTPEVRDGLFRVDRRQSSPGTEGERGSGLGLLLCHDLAERLGTALEVASVPGVGTTFSLALPQA